MNRKVILTCRLTEHEQETLKRYSRTIRQDASTIVRNAISEYLHRHPAEARTWSRELLARP